MDAQAVRRSSPQWITLVAAASELGIPYGDAYDYMLRTKLVGKKFKRNGRRRGGWYVTSASVRVLKEQLAFHGMR